MLAGAWFIRLAWHAIDRQKDYSIRRMTFMKRYWLTISLVLLAISSPVVYYGFGLNNQLPEFKLEQIAGEANQAAGVAARGAFNNGWYYNVEINAEGSEYSFEQESSFDQMNGGRYYMLLEQDMRQLIRKTDANGFYNDEHTVVYAQASRYGKEYESTQAAFQIELLDKKTNETTSYEQQVDVTEALSSIYVEDVYYEADRIYMLVSIWSGMGNSNKAVYSLSLADGTIKLNRKFDQWQPTQTNSLIHTYVRAADSSSAPNPFILLHVSEAPNSNLPEANDVSEWNANQQSFVYSYSSNELTEVSEKFANHFDFDNGIDSLQSGDRYYFGLLDANQFKLSRYQHRQQKIDIDYLVLKAEQFGADHLVKAQILGDRVYLLLKNESSFMAAICDLEDGSLLYQGKIVQTGKYAVSDNELQENFNLHSLRLAEQNEWVL
jgi:hypothetical protein